MIRVSTRVAAITYAFVIGLWAMREAYAPGRQYDIPWISASVLALLAGIGAAFWYRRHPPHPGYHPIAAVAAAWYRSRHHPRRRMRHDPGE